MAQHAQKTCRVGKIERLLNLVAFLLKQEEPVPWLTIRARVAGYDEPEAEGRVDSGGRGTRVAGPETAYAARPGTAAGERRFERDKEIVKSLGIPIEYIPRNSACSGGYYIRREACFLPRASLPPEERKILACVHTAAALDGESPVLGALTSALQKLRFDEITHDDDQPSREGLPIFKLGAGEQAGVQWNLAALVNAARQRKMATFFYHSMHRDAVEERAVEPYGAFLRAGKWYLVGRCTVKQAVRMFRLDRIMTQAEVNEKNPGQPDFQRPRGFRLKKYLGSLTWEMGRAPDAPKLYDAAVWFDEEAWWMAREALAGSRRRFRDEGGGATVTMAVYREEPLVRWLLKFGAHAVVQSPRSLRDLVVSTVKNVRQRHIS